NASSGTASCGPSAASGVPAAPTSGSSRRTAGCGSSPSGPPSSPRFEVPFLGTLSASPGAERALDGGGTAEMTTNVARRITAPEIAARKGSGTPIVMVTAYDAPTARTVDG